MIIGMRVSGQVRFRQADLDKNLLSAALDSSQILLNYLFVFFLFPLPPAMLVANVQTGGGDGEPVEKFCRQKIVQDVHFAQHPTAGNSIDFP